MALDKVAFLPFGLLVDQWRWKVFSGEIPPAQYNAAWWELREKYQGVAAPGPRPEDAFDPGAKYHVPANTPYTRYFLAHILQFQMHRAMCKAAGHTGPLHTCSIYGNKEVGARLQKMLAMGASKPWPEALEALTGESRWTPPRSSTTSRRCGLARPAEQGPQLRLDGGAPLPAAIEAEPQELTPRRRMADARHTPSGSFRVGTARGV